MPDQDPVRVNRHPPKRRHFRRVEQARAMLEAKSSAIMRAMIEKALSGDVKAQRWLLEHTAATDDQGAEIRPIAPAVDRQGLEGGQIDTQPRIVIGVQLGADFAQLAGPGSTPPALGPALPPTILDAQSQCVSDDVPTGENPNESATALVFSQHVDSAE